MPKECEERFVFNPVILCGKLVIRGTRFSVEFVLDLLAGNWAVERILGEYPSLKREDVTAVLRYAAEIVREERVYPLR